VLVFEDQERESIFDLIPIKTYIGESFENFTKKEQQSQLDHLFALMVYVKNMPESAMQKKRLAEIYNDIGKLSYSMRQYSNALSYYRFSLDLGEEVGDLNGIAAVYNNMAMAYQADGDYNRAFQYYRESLNTPVEPDDREKKASIYNNMGILLGTIGEDNLAFEHYRGSKNLFLQLGNRQGIGAVANNMGIVYELRRDFNAALEAFQESLTVFEEYRSRNELNIPVVLNNIGHVYYSRGDYDAAADCLKRRAAKLNEPGFKSRSVVTLYKLAELYKEAEQEEERIKWLRSAILHKKELEYPEKDMDWEVLANKVR
jgi:tetratricopeptide (TPR) repeat protein